MADKKLTDEEEVAMTWEQIPYATPEQAAEAQKARDEIRRMGAGLGLWPGREQGEPCPSLDYEAGMLEGFAIAVESTNFSRERLAAELRSMALRLVDEAKRQRETG